MRLASNALLISGSEVRHREKTAELAKHLRSIDVGVTELRLPTPRKALTEIRNLLERSSEDSLVLISFYGHGSQDGWESGAKKPFKSSILYKDIVSLCAKYPHHIQFLNSTCHGHFLIKHLIGARSGRITGALTDWEGYQVSYGNAISDVIRSWPQGMRPEDYISEDIYSDGSGPDLSYLPVFRWGVIYDDHFLP